MFSFIVGIKITLYLVLVFEKLYGWVLDAAMNKFVKYYYMIIETMRTQTQIRVLSYRNDKSD